MSGKFKAVFLFFSFFSFSFKLFAEIRGSETEVSVQLYYDFPAADANNTMLGFGWFKNGFGLEDSTTTCTFDSVYPVSGTVDLNGGSLYLARDLTFQNDTTFLSFGHVYGQGYAIELCSSVTSLAATYTLHDTTVYLGGDVDVGGFVTIDGDCVLRGNGYHMSFLEGTTLLIGANSTYVLEDIELRNVKDSCFKFADDSSKLVLRHVHWIQNGDFTIDKGSILFDNEVCFCGPHNFYYESTQTSTIQESTRWKVYGGMTLHVGRSESGSFVEPFYFVDETSVLAFDTSSLAVTDYGIGLTKGKFELEREVHIDVASTNTTEGLIIGTGYASDDFSMILNSGAAVHLDSGCWVYNNYNSSGKLHALSETSRCLRYGDSKFYIMRDWTIPPMVFKVVSGNPESILCDGVTFRYDKTHLSNSLAEFEITGQELSPGFKLAGDDYLYMTKGSMPLPIYVSGDGNKLYGTGDIEAVVTLQDLNTTVSCLIAGGFHQNIVLNGGSFILEKDLALEPDAVFSGSGTVYLDNHRIDFGAKDDTWNSEVFWNADGGSLQLAADVDLCGTWTFDGSCLINGEGHVLTFSTDGAIVITEGSDLTLRNLTVKNISQDRIVCLDNNSQLILDKTSWVQNDHVMFDTGRILFHNSVDFNGSYTFVYDSAMTSTIGSHARWLITYGMKLQIGRKNGVSGDEPLYMTDSSSKLRLKNCTLISTSSGICFTQGAFEIQGDVSVDSLATTSDASIMFGNGVQQDDVLVRLESGASIKFKTGWFAYNNVGVDSFVAASDGAEIIRYGDSKLAIMQSWNFPNMTFKVHSGYPQTVIADGATLSYDNTHLVFPGVEFDLTGNLVGFAQFSLTGGDTLYLTKGSFLPYLFVSNATNFLMGTGDIMGFIMLMGPTAELICCLNGSILQSITMNGGQITLSNDLHLGPGVHFSGRGAVDLDRYQAILSANDMICTDTIEWNGSGGGIKMRGNIDFSGTWTFKDSCVVDGQGNTFCLRHDGKVVIDEASELVLKNVVLDGVSQDSISCLGDNSSLVLDNVSWVQDANYTFSLGSIKIVNDVEFQGDYDFVYDSLQTSSIMQHSAWRFCDKICVKMGRKESYESAEPLYFANDTALFALKDSSFVCTSSGIMFSRGSISLGGTVNIDALSTTTQGGLMLGSGESGGDVAFRFEPGSSVHFRSGWLLYNNLSSTAAEAISATACAIKYADSKVYVMHDWQFPDMTLKVADGMPITLVDTGATMSYDNTNMKLPDVEFEYKGVQANGSLYCLSGQDSIYLTKGNLQLPSLVSGLGNRLFGTGDVSGLITFSGADAELIYSLNGLVLQSPALNGGKLTLAGNLRLGPNVCLQGPGQIDLSGYRCSLGLTDYKWTDSLCWDGDGGTLELGSQLSLHATWTFKNRCVLEGNGNVVNLNGIGHFVVDDGASLTLRNLRLQGVSDYQVRCLSEDSTVVLDNVIWEQDGVYTFTIGAMLVKNDVLMSGETTFVYESCQTSTVLTRSQLKLDSGFTFSYAPTCGSKNLLEFEDSTAQLLLKSATVHTVATGLEFSCGSLLVKDAATLCSEVLVSSEDVVTDEGISLGDGTNDMVCEIYPGANLSLIGGSLVYKNLLDSSWTMFDSRSALSLISKSKLILQESLNLGDGVIKIGPQSNIVEMSGKKLTGSIFMVQ